MKATGSLSVTVTWRVWGKLVVAPTEATVGKCATVSAELSVVEMQRGHAPGHLLDRILDRGLVGRGAGDGDLIDREPGEVPEPEHVAGPENQDPRRRCDQPAAQHGTANFGSWTRRCAGGPPRRPSDGPARIQGTGCHSCRFTARPLIPARWPSSPPASTPRASSRRRGSAPRARARPRSGRTPSAWRRPSRRARRPSSPCRCSPRSWRAWARAARRRPRARCTPPHRAAARRSGPRRGNRQGFMKVDPKVLIPDGCASFRLRRISPMVAFTAAGSPSARANVAAVTTSSPPRAEPRYRSPSCPGSRLSAPAGVQTVTTSSTSPSSPP